MPALLTITQSHTWPALALAGSVRLAIAAAALGLIGFSFFAPMVPVKADTIGEAAPALKATVSVPKDVTPSSSSNTAVAVRISVLDLDDLSLSAFGDVEDNSAQR